MDPKKFFPLGQNDPPGVCPERKIFARRPGAKTVGMGVTPLCGRVINVFVSARNEISDRESPLDPKSNEILPLTTKLGQQLAGLLWVLRVIPLQEGGRGAHVYVLRHPVEELLPGALYSVKLPSRGLQQKFAGPGG